MTCDDCKLKPASFYCDGKSDQIPEYLFHDPHHSCWECDKGRGCAMIATPSPKEESK